MNCSVVELQGIVSWRGRRCRETWQGNTSSRNRDEDPEIISPPTVLDAASRMPEDKFGTMAAAISIPEDRNLSLPI